MIHHKDDNDDDDSYMFGVDNFLNDDDDSYMFGLDNFLNDKDEDTKLPAPSTLSAKDDDTTHVLPEHNINTIPPYMFGHNTNASSPDPKINQYVKKIRSHRRTKMIRSDYLPY